MDRQYIVSLTVRQTKVKESRLHNNVSIVTEILQELQSIVKNLFEGGGGGFIQNRKYKNMNQHKKKLIEKYD